MLYITLLIFVKEGYEDTFNEYEGFVLPILQRYAGQLEYRIRPDRDQHVTTPAAYPYEIHIISFPSADHFEQYKRDEERNAFSHLLKESVSKTVLIEGFVK